MACRQKTAPELLQEQNKSNGNLTQTKPPSSSNDTIVIDDVAAIFYHPDSLQLRKIEQVTEKWIFDGSMHEYEYLIKNARNVLKKYYPHIPIVDSTTVRNIIFIKGDRSIVQIDLDQFQDAYGLVIFDKLQSPVLVDMANVDAILQTYFAKKY